MPLYGFRCDQGHETELLCAIGAEVIVVCSCGGLAHRYAVNRLAVIGQATVPRDERNYRKTYGEYREAVAEVADHYERRRSNGERVQEPNYYGMARQQAIAKGAKL